MNDPTDKLEAMPPSELAEELENITKEGDRR